MKRGVWLLALLVGICGCAEKTAGDYFDRASQELSDGNHEEAINSILSGLELEPGSATGYNLLGTAYRLKYNELRETSWKEREIQAFKKAIAADSTYAPAHVNLGATLYYLGNHSEAIPHFKKALELDPDYPDRDQLERFIEGRED